MDTPSLYGRQSRSSRRLAMMPNRGSSDSEAAAASSNRLMQLRLRAGAMRQSAGEDGEHRARGAVDRPLVQEAQRAVHDLRKYALDEDAAAQQEAHQVA